VLEGGAAGLFVVSARTSGKPGDTDGITLFLVPGEAKGLTRKALKLADSRGAANLTFDKVEVGADAVLARSGKAGRCSRRRSTAPARPGGRDAGRRGPGVRDHPRLLKVRVQFGQVIGAFQALQHRAAKMFTELELARSCVEAALTAIDNDAPDTAELVSLAKAKMATCCIWCPTRWSRCTAASA